MVYPVLINPSDLQDSDQETTPVKKDKKVKKEEIGEGLGQPKK